MSKKDASTIRQPVHEVLADVWVREYKDDIVTQSGIATEIQKIQEVQTGFRKPVTRAMFHTYISKVRRYMEQRHQCTLWLVRGTGYKIANEEETALYTARAIKNTLLYADRARSLFPITDRKYLPGALRKVFERNKSNVRRIAIDGRGYVEAFEDLVKEQRKELRHAEKDNQEKDSKKKTSNKKTARRRVNGKSV